MYPIISAGPLPRGAQPNPGQATPAGQPSPSQNGTCQHAPQGHVQLTVLPLHLYQYVDKPALPIEVEGTTTAQWSRTLLLIRCSTMVVGSNPGLCRSWSATYIPPKQNLNLNLNCSKPISSRAVDADPHGSTFIFPLGSESRRVNLSTKIRKKHGNC